MSRCCEICDIAETATSGGFDDYVRNLTHAFEVLRSAELVYGEISLCFPLLHKTVQWSLS